MRTARRAIEVSPSDRKVLAASQGQAIRTVGERLRALRKSQKMTLQTLAKAAHTDVATISRIETGKMTGTLECHLRLANVLGVKITDLYAGIEEGRTRDAVILQHVSARGDVYVHEGAKTSMAILTTDILKKKLMPILITIEPEGSTPREEMRVGTERFIYVLEGRIEAETGEQVHQLRRESSLYLDASIPHSLKNVGRQVARCLSVVTPPAL